MRGGAPGRCSPLPTARTYCTLSCGLALRRPLCTWAGSSSECSQMELAPLLAKVCTICGAEARRWVPGPLHPTQIPPRPPPQGRGTHLEQGGGPGAVAQVLDDGDVAAQAAVHAAALVTDQDAAVDGSPAGVCGGHGALRGGPFLPSNTRFFILGGQRRRSNAVVSQATARGSSHRRGKPKGFHWQPGTAWGGGQDSASPSTRAAGSGGDASPML